MQKTKKFEKVCIITKRNINKNTQVLKKLVRYLKNKKKDVYLDINAASVYKNKTGYTKEELLKKADLAVVLGGDGTILKTSRCLSRKKTLVLGVNLGTLGFLTETLPNKMLECLDKIFNGQYDIDRRSLLRVTVYSKGKKKETYLALNDAVINQGAFARLIKMDLKIDNRNLVRFKADGIIVSTPTGSTAHSLSAGGPIVHPNIEGLIIAPICPTSLSMRPIVIPDKKLLSIRIETQRREATPIIGLTIDGQDLSFLQYGDVIKFRRSKRYFYLARISNKYYKTLRGKLNWGDF